MEYVVKVNSGRITEFLEIMSAWERVGLVEHFESIDNFHHDILNSLAMNFPENLRTGKSSKSLLADAKEQYRDLVD